MGPSAQAIECPQCRHSNPPGSLKCVVCSTHFGGDMDTLVSGAAGWSMVPSQPSGAATQNLTTGSMIGNRYEILKKLGEGGMGTVYKAHDRELDRLVALKVIRPELANNPNILRRFKQELILARQVSHRNIIRIFDLGVADDLKFISMEFVEGPDLSQVLEEKRPGPKEAAKIIRQVCRALDAAHNESVIHRDLKPQNIMIDHQGKVVVMDFGLARSMESNGMTQTGALMGTPAYMSPEQAKGVPLDPRSDLFAVGIILYEVLTGVLPFQADNMLASLLKRTQEPAKPPSDLNPQVPQALSDIVMKCLAIDLNKRYQSAAEVIADLDTFIGAPESLPPTASRRVILNGLRMMSDSVAWKWISISVAAVLAVLVSTYFAAQRLGWFVKPAPTAPVTVMIADFNNHTGDSVFNGTLESTLKLALEGASFISAYDRTRMRDLGLKALPGPLDDAKAQEIAASQGLNIVVSGSVDRRGAEYQLTARAIQTVTGKVLTTTEATAPNKDQILFAVTKLGSSVRKALGDVTSESSQRLSMETLSASNLEAVHEYAAGLDTLSAGKFADAQAHLSKAVELDPNFGMAYTIMASAARNQGRFQDADRYIREAIQRSGHMTERERYRTRGYLYFLNGDYQKCVDEYKALLDRYSADTGAYTNISLCLVHLHDVNRSLELARRAVAILPKRAIYHSNLAMDLAYAGDFDGAEREAAETVKLGYVNGFLIQAFANLGQERIAPAIEAYQNLRKSLPSDAATGLADVAIYEGRYSEAVKILENGAAEDLAGRKPDKDAAATKYWMLANLQRLRKQNTAALTAAKLALDNNQEFQTRLVSGQVYAALGDEAKAHNLAAGLANELQVEPQTYAKLIEGEIAMKKGDSHEAIKFFTEANNLLDTWIGRFALGRAYLEAGAFTEADSEFDRCIKRRGEALSLFLDLSTYGYFPPVYYYQGRAREGMKTAGFADSYKKYISIRGKAGEDALLADARRRAGQE